MVILDVFVAAAIVVFVGSSPLSSSTQFLLSALALIVYFSYRYYPIGGTWGHRLVIACCGAMFSVCWSFVESSFVMGVVWIGGAFLFALFACWLYFEKELRDGR